MNEATPTRYAGGRASATRSIRWVAAVQLGLAAASGLLLLTGQWSPLLQSGTTWFAAVLAGGIVVAAALGHVVAPSGGPITVRERRWARNNHPILGWVGAVITLCFPLIVVLILVHSIHPLGAAKTARLESTLAEPMERASEQEVALKQLVLAVKARLAGQPDQSWQPGKETRENIRKTFLEVLEDGRWSAHAGSLGSDLPSWVSVTVELAALRAAPRYWKLRALTYVNPDVSMRDELLSILESDKLSYAVKQPVIRVEYPGRAASAATGRAGGLEPHAAASLAKGDGRWFLWVFLDARNVATPGSYSFKIDGASTPVIVSDKEAGKWVIWSGICAHQPGEVGEASHTVRPLACLNLQLHGLPDMPKLQAEMLRQIAAMPADDRPPILLTTNFGSMVARPSTSPRGIFIVAAQESDADRIDGWVDGAFHPQEIDLEFQPDTPVGSREGSLRIRAGPAALTSPLAIDRTQFGGFANRVVLQETTEWAALEPLADWTFTYPGLYWEDYENPHRGSTLDSARTVPFWSRVTLEDAGRKIIGYVVTLPRRNASDFGWDRLGDADRRLLWTVLNESGRKLNQDRWLAWQGLQNLGADTGTYVPVLSKEDLLLISSLSVRNHMLLSFLLVWIYIFILLFSRYQVQSIK